MSSSAFLESERKKMKIEWEQLPNPKPNWEEYKRIKFKKTYKWLDRAFELILKLDMVFLAGDSLDHLQIND